MHFPDADAPPSLAELLVEPEELEDLSSRRWVARRSSARASARTPDARPPDPPPPPRAADAALAAAAQGTEPARGRAAVRVVPDRARDVPRVPAGRLRPAGASRDPARAAFARARPRRARDAFRVADGRVASLRLRRDVHVQGRHARGRAPRPGAVARPRAPSRAARPGRAARPRRSRRAGRRGGVAATRPAQRGRASRSPSSCRRAAGRRGRRRVRGDTGAGAPSVSRVRRRRRGARRGRGRGPLSRRLRRDAARRPARDVPRAGRRPPRARRPPVRALAGAVTTAELAGGTRSSRTTRIGPARARGAGPPRQRGAPPGRHRARMVRPRRAAPHPPCDARRAAPRDRARRTGSARAVPPGLARDRPPGDAPRGARPAPGARAPGVAVGVGDPAPPRARLPAGRARPDLRVRRGRVGWDRSRSGRRCITARTRRCSARRLRQSRCRVLPRLTPRGPVAERRVLARPPLVGGARPGRRVAGPVGARLGGRGDERRLGAASREAAVRGADRGAAPAALLALSRLRRGGDRRAVVPHLTSVRVGCRTGRPAAARRTPARAPGNRHPRRRPRGRHSRRLRRGVRRAEGPEDGRRLPARTSSRVSGARGSRCRARSSGCESCARPRTTSRSCSRQQIRHSPTAVSCPGRSAPLRGRRGSPAPTSSL